QDPQDPGVLVLSRFAGAAMELGDALLVNPADTEEVADALERALAMPLGERRERWKAMMAVLQHNDITAWRTRFMSTLRAAPSAQTQA
ncbi:MAG: trehalose-6-phosphate synthase, partial [Rhodanobacter sp.]